MIHPDFIFPDPLEDEHHFRLFPYGFLDAPPPLEVSDKFDAPEFSILSKRNAREADLEDNFENYKVARLENENLNVIETEKLKALKNILTEDFISSLSDVARKYVVRFDENKLKKLSKKPKFEKILSNILEHYETLVMKYGFSHNQIMQMAGYSGAWENINSVISCYEKLVLKYGFNHEQMVHLVKCHGGWRNIHAVFDNYDVLVTRYGFSNDDIVNMVGTPGGHKYMELFFEKVPLIEKLGLEVNETFRMLFFSHPGIPLVTDSVNKYIQKEQNEYMKKNQGAAELFSVPEPTPVVAATPAYHSHLRKLLPKTDNDVAAPQKKDTTPVRKKHKNSSHVPPRPSFRPYVFLEGFTIPS